MNAKNSCCCPLQCGVAVLSPSPTVATVRRSRHLTRASRWNFVRIINTGTGTGWSAALLAVSGAAVGHVDVIVPADSVGTVEVTLPD